MNTRIKYFLIVSAIASVFAACKKEDPSPAASTPAPTPRHVKYSIQANDVDVIYKRANGTDTVIHHQNSSFNYEFDGHAGDIVTLIGINQTSNPQSVGATIYLNGSVLRTGTSYCPITGLVMLQDTLH